MFRSVTASKTVYQYLSSTGQRPLMWNNRNIYQLVLPWPVSDPTCVHIQSQGLWLSLRDNSSSCTQVELTQTFDCWVLGPQRMAEVLSICVLNMLADISYFIFLRRASQSLNRHVGWCWMKWGLLHLFSLSFFFFFITSSFFTSFIVSSFLRHLFPSTKFPPGGKHPDILSLTQLVGTVSLESAVFTSSKLSSGFHCSSTSHLQTLETPSLVPEEKSELPECSDRALHSHASSGALSCACPNVS